MMTKTEFTQSRFHMLTINDMVPDYSTISQNRRRRFNGTVLFRTFFEQIVQQCIDRGLVDGKLILTDSTHVKANASRKSEYKKTIKALAYDYIKELDHYEKEERIALETKGLIPKAKKKNVSREKYKTETITCSKTDPDSG